MNKRILIGIDGGFGNSGTAIVLEENNTYTLKYMGLIRTKKDPSASSVSEDNFNRTKQIYHEIMALVNNFVLTEESGLYDVCIYSEAMSYPRNSSTASKLSLVWGVLASISAGEGIEVKQISPKKIKKYLTGKNTASKKEVEESLKNIFTAANFDVLLEKVPNYLHEHPFDALGAIVGGLQLKENIDVREVNKC